MAQGMSLWNSWQTQSLAALIPQATLWQKQQQNRRARAPLEC